MTEAVRSNSKRKRCSSCGEIRRLSHFRPHGRTDDGFGTVCADCLRARKAAKPEIAEVASRPKVSLPLEIVGVKPTRAALRRGQALWRMYEKLSQRGYDGRVHPNPLSPQPVIKRVAPVARETFGFSLARRGDQP